MPIAFHGMNKCLIALSLFMAIAIFGSSRAFSGGSPVLLDLPEWDGGETIFTALETSSEKPGYWVERRYTRKSDGHSINVILLEGPGTAWQGLPDGTVSADDGLIGSGATYRTFYIGGYKGVLEWHPLTGNALVVELAPDRTVTLETIHDDVDLEGFALKLIDTLNAD